MKNPYLTDFRCLKNAEINLGLMMDNPFIISKRIYFERKFCRLKRLGFKPKFLDETFCNGKK